MPISVKEVAGGSNYGNPLVGDPGPFTHIKLDVSGLTEDEVDTYGYLKPGVLLNSAGDLLGAADFAYCIVVEATKLPIVVPATDASLAAETGDPLIAVCTGGLINRDVVEDNLGRALTADELDAIITAGSQFSLTTT
jgi:hypothetical protein